MLICGSQCSQYELPGSSTGLHKMRSVKYATFTLLSSVGDQLPQPAIKTPFPHHLQVVDTKYFSPCGGVVVGITRGQYGHDPKARNQIFSQINFQRYAHEYIIQRAFKDASFSLGFFPSLRFFRSTDQAIFTHRGSIPREIPDRNVF